jgi:hypothetical protein
MDELYLSGYDWAERYGFRIVDPDGWRSTLKIPADADHDEPYVLKYASMLDEIGEWEFWHRVAVSTVEGLSKKAMKKLEEQVRTPVVVTHRPDTSTTALADTGTIFVAVPKVAEIASWDQGAEEEAAYAAWNEEHPEIIPDISLKDAFLAGFRRGVEHEREG